MSEYEERNYLEQIWDITVALECERLLAEARHKHLLARLGEVQELLNKIVRQGQDGQGR